MHGAVKEFIQDITGELIEAGFGIELVNKNKLPCSNRGEFDETAKTLRVAIGGPQKFWFPVAVHEYCHFLQYKEQSKLWTSKAIDKAYTEVFTWLEDENHEIPEDKLMPYIGHIQAVEQDCDQRVVELIKARELPIDVPDYIQRSNVYIWFYNGVAEWRTWSKTAPYTIDEIVEVTPKRFLPEAKWQRPSKKFMRLLKEKSMFKRPQFRR